MNNVQRVLLLKIILMTGMRCENAFCVLTRIHFIRMFIEAFPTSRIYSVLMDQFYAAAELTGVHNIHATS